MIFHVKRFLVERFPMYFLISNCLKFGMKKMHLRNSVRISRYSYIFCHEKIVIVNVKFFIIKNNIAIVAIILKYKCDFKNCFSVK